MNIKEQVQVLVEDAKTLIQKITSMSELNDLKAKFLGKTSPFAALMGQMKSLSNEERPLFGQVVNDAKNEIARIIDEFREKLEKEAIDRKLRSEAVDVTLPGVEFAIGSKHLISKTIEDIENLFVGMGYAVKEGPEIELDLYNFEMLNLPKGHPARDMQDTFYITEDLLLRTHTSPVQIRTMLETGGKQPIKIICPGKVYRRDDDDLTHSHQFTQIEALIVDESVTLADLKGTLLKLAQHLFGDERQIRLRPSYFPFTEPSVEVDVSCGQCGGKGCSMCKQSGWIEVLGAGIVNNAVLEAAGYDSKKYQGFALGMGVERIVLLKYGIDDIRALYANDLRFNRQFK
jgi:phenylalanyl-tRNA synthetase alpha chain